MDACLHARLSILKEETHTHTDAYTMDAKIGFLARVRVRLEATNIENLIEVWPYF